MFYHSDISTPFVVSEAEKSLYFAGSVFFSEVCTSTIESLLPLAYLHSTRSFQFAKMFPCQRLPCRFCCFCLLPGAQQHGPCMQKAAAVQIQDPRRAPPLLVGAQGMTVAQAVATSSAETRQGLLEASAAGQVLSGAGMGPP